jgi:hypothetical protein
MGIRLTLETHTTFCDDLLRILTLVTTKTHGSKFWVDCTNHEPLSMVGGLQRQLIPSDAGRNVVPASSLEELSRIYRYLDSKVPAQDLLIRHIGYLELVRKVSFWISGEQCLSACADIVIVDQISKAKATPGPDGTVQVKLSHGTLPRVTTTNRGTKDWWSAIITRRYRGGMALAGCCFLGCELQRMPVCLRKWTSYQYLTVLTFTFSLLSLIVQNSQRTITGVNTCLIALRI